MQKIWIIILSVLMAGCSVASRLEHRQSRAIAEYRPKKEVISSGDSNNTRDSITDFYQVRKDTSSYYLAPTIKLENGEWVGSMELEEIVVVAKSRTISERNGKVTIDFVITLPKELQGNCQSVSVIPYLHKAEEIEPLQEITIRGGLFSRVQDRNYWQFRQYVRVFRPNPTEEQRAFDKWVKYPYPEGVRLDSIVESREKLSYYYTQDVPTTGEGKTMLITLHGRVIGLDGSYYRIPVVDTLEYNISSMLSFVDKTPRYITKVIEKYAEVSDRNYLTFKVNDTRIIDSLGNNRDQLGRIDGLMDALINQKDFIIDSITLTATASPEGVYSRNNILAKERALSLKSHLKQRFGNIEDILNLKWIAEDWETLRELIANDQNIYNKENVLKVIESVKEPDKREAIIKTHYPKDYTYLKTNLYPRLRAVNFQYHLRRAGMIKDTIHTTEPDMRYAEAVELLNNRRYTEALHILQEYRDQNCAVAMLSVGHDEEAYNVLSHLPATESTEYLLAITCARLGYIEEGRRHFLNACNLNENLQYRGNLDPEVNTLLKIEKL